MSVLREGTVEDYNQKIFQGKQYKFILNHQNESPSITNDGRPVRMPVSVTFPLYDKIYDDSVKKERVIRYIPGQPVIYEDQMKLDKPREEPVHVIEFVNGEKIVPGTDSELLTWMMTTDWNGSNKNRNKAKPIKFWLLDNGSALESVIKKDQHSALLKSWCYTAEPEEIELLAMVLGMDTEVNITEIRYNLKLMAERNPDLFEKTKTNPMTKRKALILKAIKEGILFTEYRDNSLNWSVGGKIIVAPKGKSAVDHFVDNSTGQEGEVTMMAIKEQLFKLNLITGAQAAITPPPAHIQDADLDAMFAKLFESEKLERKGAWIFWEGGKAQGELSLKKMINTDKALYDKFLSWM